MSQPRFDIQTAAVIGAGTMGRGIVMSLANAGVQVLWLDNNPEMLEQALGAPVTAFCYPYGDHGPEHRAMVREAGYDNATLTQRGLAAASDDPYGLPRVTVARSTNIVRFLQKCLTRYEDTRRRR